MMSLFIDTSSFRLTIAVINEENNTIVSYYNELLKKDLSEKVLEVIKKCIDDSKIIPRDIKKIYIVNGPGSFTGVRIGVTIAKTFAWSMEIKLIPISSLEVLASLDVDNKYIVPMIDARRGFVYAGIYDQNLENYLHDSYISLDDLMKKLPEDYVFVSDDQISNITTINSNINLLKVIKKHKNDEGVIPHSLVPSYLKLTEAESNLMSKNDNRN